MPIIRFVAVAGAILVGLLFLANATLQPRGPLFTNNSEGLPRAQPVRPQVAEQPQEAPRPRAPTLVPATRQQPATAEAASVTKPAAPAIAEIAETVETPPATAQVRTELADTEPAKSQPAKTEIAKVAKTESIKTETTKAALAKTQPASVETAKLEAGAAEPANSNFTKREVVTTARKETQREATRTAPASKMYKQVTRKPERGSRYAAYRDGQTERNDVPVVENGYAYGVAPRKERAEWQRPSGGEFGQSRFRF
jgi:hypothetical protein